MVEWLIISIAVIAGLFLLQFYRDPERAITKGAHMVSPADGRVLSVIDVTQQKERVALKLDKELVNTITKGVKDAKWIVQIYLNPFNVHVTRSPMAGKIKDIEHIPGKLLNAFRPASIANERVSFLIEGKETIKMMMVGAPFVHKVKEKVQKGEQVQKGQRMGQFLLGSQVTLVLPEKKILVKKGDRVKAGITVIAE